MPDFKYEVPILKVDKQKRIVLGVVYEPNTPDAHDDFATEEEIEKAAHNFMMTFRKIDEQHDFVAGSGIPVESYIAPVDIPELNIKKGSWVLATKILDEAVFEKVLKGEIKAYSMAGIAKAGKEVEMDSDWYDEDGNYKSLWD